MYNVIVKMSLNRVMEVPIKEELFPVDRIRKSSTDEEAINGVL